MCWRFLPTNIYGNTAAMKPTLRLRLTGHIQRLKYTVESWKIQIIKMQIYFLVKWILLL